MSQNWTDLISTKNPISEATICGDNVSFDTYLAQAEGVRRGDKDYILNGSDLSEFSTCPHRWVSGYKDEGTKATDWGTLIDLMLMDPNFQERVAVCPETYKSDKGEDKPWNFNAGACKEWRTKAEAEGKQVVKAETYADALAAAAIVKRDERIMRVLADSRKQVMITGFYVDKETGIRVPVRALLDLVPPKSFLADFKTSGSAHPRAWSRHVFQYGYHTQAARHLDLWNAATGEYRVEFRHYIQESYAPWETGRRILSEEYVVLGRDTYVRALKRYAQCLASGVWPGYDEAGNGSDMVIDGHTLVQPEAWMVGAE